MAGGWGEGYRSYPGRSAPIIGGGTSECRSGIGQKSAEAIVPEFLQREGPNVKESSEMEPLEPVRGAANTEFFFRWLTTGG